MSAKLVPGTKKQPNALLVRGRRERAGALAAGQRSQQIDHVQHYHGGVDGGGHAEDAQDASLSGESRFQNYDDPEGERRETDDLHRDRPPGQQEWPQPRISFQERTPAESNVGVGEVKLVGDQEEDVPSP